LRILHTADWHLGRTLHRASLLDDQRHIMAQLCDIAAREKPDVVVIAGDVFDRPVVTADAVELLSETLATLVLSLGLPVIAIAGNHDNPQRLSFGAKLFASQRLHIFGAATREAACVTLADGHGEVAFYCVPWTDPATARHLFQQDGVRDHQGAMQCCVDVIDGCRNGAPKQRSVLVAHAFVSGAAETESERKPIVGGADHIGSALFDGFDYVALGHLHRPQHIAREAVRYAGSPLAYSFDHGEGEKCVKIVELEGDGQCSVEQITLSPLRKVRTLRGELAQLLDGPAAGESADDYICVELAGQHAVLDPFRRLLDLYPNLLHLKFAPVASANGNGEPTYEARPAQSELELFADFYRELLGADIPDDEHAVLAQQLSEFEAAERESAQ
jgi:exonuclease SbcD